MFDLRRHQSFRFRAGFAAGVGETPRRTRTTAVDNPSAPAIAAESLLVPRSRGDDVLRFLI
jgi:hypothetical protein